MDDLKPILPNEFNASIIGTVDQTLIPVYSMTKIIKVLVKNHQMDYFEAKEHMEQTIQCEFNENTNAILVDDLHFVM